jgi:hypothetical protein
VIYLILQYAAWVCSEMYGIVSSHPCARGWEIYFQDYLHSFFFLYRQTLLTTMQKLRRTKEGVEEGGGVRGARNMRTAYSVSRN